MATSVRAATGATADVTVRGAGVFGLAVAWACVRRGARVQVIDPHGPGAGASGGVVGALSPHAPGHWDAAKAFQLEALLSAEAFWREVAQVGGADPGHARSGRLQPLPDAAAVARAHERAALARPLWQDRAVWEVVAAPLPEGWIAPAPTGLYIRDDLSGRIAPRAAVAALVAAITARGGRVLREGADEGAVVWAVGHAGLAEGAPPLGRGVKGQAARLAFAARTMPQLYAEGLHVVPHADGTVAVGSTTEQDWTVDGPDSLLDAVIARARRICPALAGAPVIERWAGIRPRAAHRLPLLGHHPLRPGAFIANGGFKIGFGLAPLVGKVMADLILEGHADIPADFTLPRPSEAHPSTRPAP